MEKITVQFVMDEQGLVNFVNPCCEMMSVDTFFKMAGILVEMTAAYNGKIGKSGKEVNYDIR